MSSWWEIEDGRFLGSINVIVVKADHADSEKLDWRLTVEDGLDNQFVVDIWQKHDSQVEWKEGCEYQIRNGYGQTWSNGQKKKLHSSQKWYVEQLDRTDDCRIMVMGDSHVGRKEHPKKSYKSVDCAGKFKEAIGVAVSNDTDLIIHTGDVFHDYATDEDCNTIELAFRMLDAADIEFYYILGNHECERGKDLLKDWERNGVATHLDLNGTEIVPGTKIYGYDHHSPDNFSVEAMNLPSRLGDHTAILVLHQTLGPFRSGAEVDLNEINSYPSGGFDYVVSGHLHEPERPEWDDGELLYAGSTEDLSKNFRPSDPSVWFLTINENSIHTQRHKL